MKAMIGHRHSTVGAAFLSTLVVATLLLVFPMKSHAQTCGTMVWDLTAGQTIKAGTVTVSNDMDNLYVTYTLTYPGASLGTVHMWAGNDLTLVPMARNGAPIPGQFPHISGAGGLTSSAGSTTYTFTVPFKSLSIADANAGCGTALYIVTHAEVTMDSDGDGIMDHETAFGGPTPGAGPRWWFFGSYTICCDFGPPVACYKTTAFAKGGYVWTTDKKSNPENLPSLSLIKNRWGWAINLTSPVTNKTYDIYAGAGLNNTAKGQKAGALTVSWDGANAVVTYTMLNGYFLEEVHIYASDDKPTTTAPGQFGYPEAGYDALGATSFTENVPLADTDGNGVWLIAHALVSNGQCD